MWRCPGCQYNFIEKIVDYFCFCGKNINPKFNSFKTPHSCNSICNKKRNNNCSHLCVEICHPGPCPDCNLLRSIKKCNCGKITYFGKCGNEKIKCCGMICEKRLDCGKHYCENICHIGY